MKGNTTKVTKDTKNPLKDQRILNEWISKLIGLAKAGRTLGPNIELNLYMKIEELAKQGIVKLMPSEKRNFNALTYLEFFHRNKLITDSKHQEYVSKRLLKIRQQEIKKNKPKNRLTLQQKLANRLRSKHTYRY